MQRIFAPGGLWPAPWMERVLPVVTELAARFPERTVFTRFITPERPEAMPGTWQLYYRRWREATRENLDPAWLELVDPLRRFVPPAAVIDKGRYSAFAGSALLAQPQEREADGGGGVHLWLPGSGSRSFDGDASSYVKMNGREVFKFATRVLVSSGEAANSPK